MKNSRIARKAGGIALFTVIGATLVYWAVAPTPERPVVAPLPPPPPTAVASPPPAPQVVRQSVTPPPAPPPPPPPKAEEPKLAETVADPALSELEKEVSESDQTFFDPEYHVTGVYPAGWLLRNAPRWGQKETTLFFSDPDHPTAAPSVYYRMFDTPMQLTPSEIKPWLQETTEGKARMRVAAGMADYTNGEVVPRNIGDRPAVTWTATYTRNGEPWGEYLTRIYSPNGTLLFFLNAPVKDLPAMIPKFETMIQKTIIP